MTEQTCLWCGEPEVLEIAEIWSTHEFMMETCCSARHEQLLAEMADDPEWATKLLRHLGAEELTGFRLRRLYDNQCSSPVLDFRLTVEPVQFATMQAFVRDHHAHCPPPVTWRFGAAIFNGRTQIGVVSVGNPVARAYMHRGWVEVNRLCIRRDTAPQLRWCACSQLYGHAAREAERRGFSKIITYIREDEGGSSLKAAGWQCGGPAGGRSWNGGSRRRNTDNAFVPKLRWSRLLKPKPARGPHIEPPTRRPARQRSASAWLWAA